MSKDTIGKVNEDKEVCVCKVTCPTGCKGECGCAYCDSAYQDYLSGLGDR